MVGMHGSYYANKAVQNCDLLINFGSRFDDRIIGNPKTFANKAKIIHVDIEEKILIKQLMLIIILMILVKKFLLI